MAASGLLSAPLAAAPPTRLSSCRGRGLVGGAGRLTPSATRPAPCWHSCRRAALPARASLQGATSIRMPQGFSTRGLGWPAPLGTRRKIAPASGDGKTELSGEGKGEPGAYVLYNDRWVQLALLSLLALLSDWLCFSLVAVPTRWEALSGSDPAELLDLFLFTNVASCFFVTDIARSFGLRNVVTFAAGLMTVGAILRSGVPFSGDLPSYTEIVVGTICVGAAQPFFQCTPPLLSSTWFGNKERALSTSVAINFNQVGIATAFIVGGIMVKDDASFLPYFSVITVATAVVTVASFLLFKDRPPTPPSASAAAAIARHDEERAEGFSVQYPKVVMELVRVPGFLLPLAAFVCSIGVSNVVSAFTDDGLKRGGFTDQFGIDLAGAGFQMAIVLGGIFVGGYVDRTKKFKAVTLALLSSALGLLIFLGLAEGYQLNVSHFAFIAALLGLGAAVGPVQPINAELAVEVAYPKDENAIEATQQLCGNLFSALLVPLCQVAAAYDLKILPALQFGSQREDIRGDTGVLILLVLVTFFIFSRFDSPLKREEADREEEGKGEAIAVESVTVE